MRFKLDLELLYNNLHSLSSLLTKILCEVCYELSVVYLRTMKVNWIKYMRNH